jgi:hypothetical protein
MPLLHRLTVSLMIALAALLAPGGVASKARAGDEVRVTVIVILGSSDPKAAIEEELEEIAKQLQKKDKSLVGFRVGKTTCKSVPVGGKDKFPLADDEVVVVYVLRGLGDDERVQLEIKPPKTQGPIHYSCCCGKYFPVMTDYYTKGKNERVILAVMADPCKVKK